MLTGLVLPTAGDIRFDGKDITGRPPEVAAQHGIGRTFQHAHIVADMSVLDSVLVGTHSRGTSGPIAAIFCLKGDEEQRLRQEAMREIDRVGLCERGYQRADSLPLGQLRLLEIARAVAMDPILLLLDEPAAGLRHQERISLIALLKRLRSEGMAILLVEHDMNFINSLADRIVVLDFGTKIAEGSPAEIRSDPAVRNAYLGMSQ
jgi:branched-chain amino acid transport system permease protein